MKNKKIIIVAIIVIVVCAILFGIFKAKFNSNYLYNEDGSIAGSNHNEAIERVKAIESPEGRALLINALLENGELTQAEANELY